MRKLLLTIRIGFLSVQVNAQLLKLQSADSLLTGSYASANIYWHVVGPLNVALEGIYGERTDEFERYGNNLRIQAVVEYNF